MNEPLNHEPIQILRKFFQAMHDWELEANLKDKQLFDNENATKDDVELLREHLKKELTSIFQEYCVAGKTAKRVVEPNYYSVPPAYDVEKEIVESVIEKGNKVIIETQQTHQFKNRFKYELIKLDGKWKIKDNRKYQFNQKDKWSPDPL